MNDTFIRRGFLLIFLFLTLSFQALASDETRSETTKGKTAVDWIRTNAIPLRTVEAGHSFEDMHRLKAVVGNARIVGLGEATHGTREFFQLKHRMIEFLATQMGFTIFSIEANMPEAYRLNDYVLRGTGEPKALLRGMYFWTWQTEEVLDMIEWMREFNRSGKGHIEFTGFDMQTPIVAMEIVRKYVAEHNAPYLATLDPVWQQVTSTRPPKGFGVATATFPVEAAAGKTVTFSGYIKTENITRGYAGLWWRVDGEKDASGTPKVLAFDNMNKTGPRGTTPWTRYEIKLKVPADAKNINFGVLHPGNGTAWFDSLQVELDGKPYTDTTQFDLDFESEKPRGFFTGGLGYKVTTDNQEAHSGKHSLRSTCTDTSLPDNTADPKLVAAACGGVLRDLENLRGRASADAANLKELEWVIQNARVVLQYAQLNAQQKSRDESMADNIKWIAEQNPGAKIVLWAHNGHIAHGGYPYATMGGYLRKMFGTQYVNFGFAFNQGSFQAIEMGKGLHDFTVGPAPAGSWDEALASAGLPVMALDLRKVPEQGAVAEWIKAPHAIRNIGAVFSDEYANQYFQQMRASEAFDVLLFVEKTTAARGITSAASQALTAAFRPLQSKIAGMQEFRDPEYGVSFTMPSGWTVAAANRWGDRETTAALSDPQAQAKYAALYFRILPSPRKITPEEMKGKLTASARAKVAQRQGEGFTDYLIPEDLCHERSVGGRAALECVGTYTQDGREMREYLLWVGSDGAFALFFARVAAAQFSQFRDRFDLIVESLQIP